MSLSSHEHELNPPLMARRQLAELDDDSSTMPLPTLTRKHSPTMPCPPPVGPLPEPSFQTQLLLGDMFSHQATLRNYCADSIQAFMMALDDQHRAEELQEEEEASMALIRALQEQDAMAVQHQRQQQSTQRHSLISDLSISSNSRNISSSEDSGSYDESHSTNDNNHTISRSWPDYFTTQEAQLSQLSRLTFEEEIMPMPPTGMEKKESSGSDEKKQKSRLERTKLKAPPPGSQYCSKTTSNTTTTTNDKSSRKKRERQCIICHRSTADCKLRMRKLSCGHQFCRACIDRWLETKDSCPYCRQKVSEKTRQKVRRQNSVGAATA